MRSTLRLADCELTCASVCKPRCRCWPHKAWFASGGSGACQDPPLYMPILKLLGSCSDVIWSWPLCLLQCWFQGLLEGTLVQINVRYCLWLVLGNLFGAIKQPTVCGCLCWAWVCVVRTKLHTKTVFYLHWVGEQVRKCPKAPKSPPPPASAFWLPVRLNN